MSEQAIQQFNRLSQILSKKLGKATSLIPPSKAEDRANITPNSISNSWRTGKWRHTRRWTSGRPCIKNKLNYINQLLPNMTTKLNQYLKQILELKNK